MTAPLPPAGRDQLEAWLRQHRDQFTDDALRVRLLDAGHPAEDIDAALAALRAPSRAPAPAPRRPRAEEHETRNAWAGFAVAMLGIVGFPALFVWIGAANLGALVGFMVFLVVLVGWGISREEGRPGLARGLGAALLTVVVLPVVAVVGLFGYCLVQGGQA